VFAGVFVCRSGRGVKFFDWLRVLADCHQADWQQATARNRMSAQLCRTATGLSSEQRLLRLLQASPEQQEAIDGILGLAPRPPAPGPPAPPAGNGAAAEPFIPKAEMARRLNRDVRTMTTWMRQGLVPYYKIAHTVAFKWSEVEKQLAVTCRVGRPRF
jgi:hypothetical protein